MHVQGGYPAILARLLAGVALVIGGRNNDGGFYARIPSTLGPSSFISPVWLWSGAKRRPTRRQGEHSIRGRGGSSPKKILLTATTTHLVKYDQLQTICQHLVYSVMRNKSSLTSVKLVSELREITFSSGKPKLMQAEVSTFQGF